jgi:cardiolipin synthase
MDHTRWHFYLKTEDAWASMKEACLNAKTSIDVEQYVLENDETGQEFLELLISKRKLGVHVRILCDMVGSYNLYTSNLPDTLRDIGIEVRFFNTIKPWRLFTFFSWFFRDHRKLMIVDATTGFIGGVGYRKDMRPWRDTHIRVTGPIISEMRFAYEEMWETAGAENFFRRMNKTRKFIRGFNFVTNSPFLLRRFMYHALIEAIQNAQKYIYITTPYFIPDRRLRRVLRLAAGRGVDVKILLPESSNHKNVDSASRTCFKKLLSSGVKIFLYTNEMIHAKTVVIDDNWSTVGSFNLDSLSFFYNYEANIVSTKTDFAEEVRKYFEIDLSHAERVSPTEWHNRPFHQKFRETLFLPLRRFL